MNIQEALTKFNKLKANHFDEALKVGWLSDVDGKVIQDVMAWHEGEAESCVPYTTTDMTQELLIPDPYTDVYMRYMSIQADYYNGDFERFNNGSIMYNTAWEEYVNWYNRNHMPKQSNYIDVR